MKNEKRKRQLSKSKRQCQLRTQWAEPQNLMHKKRVSRTVKLFFLAENEGLSNRFVKQKFDWAPLRCGSNLVLIPSQQTKKELHKVKLFSLAENEGFEPPVPCGTPVFKTGAFDHSANSPRQKYSKVKYPQEFPHFFFTITNIFFSPFPFPSLSQHFTEFFTHMNQQSVRSTFKRLVFRIFTLQNSQR